MHMYLFFYHSNSIKIKLQRALSCFEYLSTKLAAVELNADGTGKMYLQHTMTLF